MKLENKPLKIHKHRKGHELRCCRSVNHTDFIFGPPSCSCPLLGLHVPGPLEISIHALIEMPTKTRMWGRLLWL